MRCSLLLLLAACQTIDVDERIAVVSDHLPPDMAGDLVEAARCWNLEFGVHFLVGEPAHQAVEAFIDNATCLAAAAQTQGSSPSRISICPPRYWPALNGPFYTSDVTPFRVLSHELGHVLNIVGHPDDSNYTAVMLRGGAVFQPMFQPVDHALFDQWNQGFIEAPACPRVVRSFLPGGQVGHCACEDDSVDVNQPIALVAPTLDPTALANAAACWNLRYGIHLVVGAPAAQTAYLDRCLEPVTGRTTENGTIEACVLNYDPLLAIAVALGSGSFMTWGHPVACANIVIAPDGSCSCG